MLAAGGSRRLGLPKQLVRYRARPLLLHAVAAARGALPNAPLIVVVGAEALRLRLTLRRARCAARVVANSALGARARDVVARGPRAPRRAPAGPRSCCSSTSRASTLQRSSACSRRGGGARHVPAAASYDGRSGVPAVLPRRRWRALRSLRGDQGARALLRGSSALTLVDMPEAALDIDTPADLAKLR